MTTRVAIKQVKVHLNSRNEAVVGQGQFLRVVLAAALPECGHPVLCEYWWVGGWNPEIHLILDVPFF